MLEEILEYLNLGPGKIIVDATVGTAGHSAGIIDKISPGGKLICIDRDEESLAIARERLCHAGQSCQFIYGNFAEIDKVLELLNIKNIDGVLFDLGLSSLQLGDPQRGFSFQNEGPLDMRMDRNSYISAYDLVNNLNEDEISALLWNFGEERWHHRIAHVLTQEREAHPISTTRELADIVIRAIPSRFRHRHYRIHPATRTFQAMRIAVNRELENLEQALCKAINMLKPEGRICVISFHSLEDRIVKMTFKRFSLEGKITILTQKPIGPLLGEARENPSSRSAKLRVAQGK